MVLGWLEDPVLGSELVVMDLLIAGAIFLIGIILSFWFPKMLATNISKIFANLEERSLLKRFKKDSKEIKKEKGHIDRRLKRTLVRPLQRALVALYILTFLVLAIYSLDIEMGTTFRLFERDYEAWRFLQFGVTFSLIFIIAALASEPVLRASIYASLGPNIRKARKYSLFRSIRRPMKWAMVLVGLYLGLVLSFTKHQLHPIDWLVKILLFLIIMLFSYLAAQLFVTITEPTIEGKDKMNLGKTTGKAVGRVIKVVIYVIGGIVAMILLGLDPLTIAASSVVIGLVLGFGLQDTIGNFAAGIMITLDKPFVIGDRIRISWSAGNETWGDVKDISLRSTWINTPEDEMIVIPNNMIAASQIWNYTRESPKVALHFDVGISYDSDWKLAETLVLKILRKHPLVLNRPHPYVLMKEFGESAQILTVWFWIPEARDKVVIQSDILKRIKDSFDKNGVEIPYPYRTVVYKNDIPKPDRMAEDYSSPMYLPSTGFKKVKIEESEVVEVDRYSTVILAPVSSSYPAKYTAPYVMETAKKMGGSVAALFIKSSGGSVLEGQRALRIYNQVAKAYGVEIKLIFKEGDILENILDVVESEKASLVVMGSTEESLFGSLTRRSVSQELLLHLNIPTMIIPFTPEGKERYKKARMMEMIEPASYSEDAVDFSSLGKMEEIGPKEGEKEEGSMEGFLGA